MGKPVRRRAKLTDQIVAGLRPAERVYDTIVAGFFLERGPSENSRASFRVLADLPTRKRTLSMPKTLFRTVGRAGSGDGEFSAKAARIEAQKLIADIKRGIDPKGVHRGPDGPTLMEAWQDYRDDALLKPLGRRRGPARPNTLEYYRHCYERLRKWHNKPLALIAADRVAVKKMHDELTKDCGGRAADASLHFAGLVARHAHHRFPTIPEWPRKAYVPNGSRDMSDRGLGLKELPIWWTGLQQHRDKVKREMLLFMLLTGLRSQDVRLAKLEQVNEETRTLFLPEPKGGPKRAFHLPLTEPMLACLQRAREAWCREGERDPSKFLFPTARGQGHYTEARTKRNGERVIAGHDLRRSFATCAEAAGYMEDEYGPLILNHKSRSVTGKYPNRDLLHERKLDMLTNINRVIVEAIGL
jgi:Phage integrase family